MVHVLFRAMHVAKIDLCSTRSVCFFEVPYDIFSSPMLYLVGSCDMINCLIVLYMVGSSMLMFSD